MTLRNYTRDCFYVRSFVLFVAVTAISNIATVATASAPSSASASAAASASDHEVELTLTGNGAEFINEALKNSFFERIKVKILDFYSF